MAEFDLLPVEVHFEPLESIAFEMIFSINNPKLAVYDFIYLALAEELDCRLLTAERIFDDAVVATSLGSRLKWVADPI